MKKSSPKAKSTSNMLEEDGAVYKTSTKKKLTEKEKKILDDLSHSIDFVKKYTKGSTKVKSINQLLHEL